MNLEPKSDYFIAAGTVDITPDMPLPTFSSSRAPVSRADGRLELNAIVLGSGSERIALLSFDSLSVGQPIRAAIMAATDIAGDRLFTAATHTHFAPAMDPGVPAFMPDSQYLQTTSDRASDLVNRLLKTTSERASAAYLEGRAHHSINRRRARLALRRNWPFWKRIWEMRPNWFGAKDETIRIVRFTDDTGRLLAVLWGYSCHPVCFPDAQSFSGDFPAVVRDAIREHYGPVPVIYFQGFCGNTRPKAFRRRFTKRNILRPPAFAAFDWPKWKQWSGSLAACVLGALKGPAEPMTGTVRTRRWGVPVAELGPQANGRVLMFHEVRIGDAVSLFGISAEVLNEYTERVSRLSQAKHVIPVGCIDDVGCYLPTSAAVRQGGYESERSMGVYGLSGRFRSDIDAEIERRIAQPVP